MSMASKRISDLETFLLGITIGDVAAILHILGDAGSERIYIRRLGKEITVNELIKSALKYESAHYVQVNFYGGPIGVLRCQGTLKTFVIDRILYYSQFESYVAILKKVKKILQEPLPF